MSSDQWDPNERVRVRYTYATAGASGRGPADVAALGGGAALIRPLPGEPVAQGPAGGLGLHPDVPPELTGNGRTSLALPHGHAATEEGGIDLRPGQKMLILGMNGSGKSVFAQAVARAWALGPVVIVDTKGDDPAALSRTLPFAQAPTRYAAGSPAGWRGAPGPRRSEPGARAIRTSSRPLWCRFEQVRSKLYEQAQATRCPTLVVVHELREFCTEQQIGPAFRELITAGRSLGIYALYRVSPAASTGRR